MIFTHAWFQQQVLDLLQRFDRDWLVIELPDGAEVHCGNPAHPEEPARMRIVHPRCFKRVVLAGEVGLGEAYMEGDWETPNLTRVMRALMANLHHVPNFGDQAWCRWSFNLLGTLDRWGHGLRRNTRPNSRRNIQAHYDLSNDFYRLWLDTTWTYSSAYFEAPDQPLEAAQETKYRRLGEKLGLQSGQRVLEIGCGWGGFALFAARHFGVHVTGVTISQAQFEQATQRVQEARLTDQVDIRLQDYRELEGQFDAIVSIEMLEAVGHEFLPAYFAQIHRLLKPEGVIGLQVIISPDDCYERGRRSTDWIKKHIFPGGQLPSVGAILGAINRTGDLYLQHLENFGLHYAQTLQVWRERFNGQREQVQRLGFDEGFMRKWNYYLSYCEAAFDARCINVSQMVFTRPHNVRYAVAEEAKVRG